MDVNDINSFAPKAKAKEFETKEYKVFEMFRKDWAVVRAGTPDKFNSCVVGWGSLGTIWTVPGKKTGATVTVYIYPTRYVWLLRIWIIRKHYFDIRETKEI